LAFFLLIVVCMNYSKKLNWVALVGLASALLGPVGMGYAAAEDIVVRTGPSHHERERREVARERAREHEEWRERRAAERWRHDRHVRHERREVYVVP
jgi:hypothetical protein